MSSVVPAPFRRAALEVVAMTDRHACVLSDMDFVQPAALYRDAMSERDRTSLVNNIVGHLGGAQESIQLRQTTLFYTADAEWGERVANGLGLEVAEVKRLAAMSQKERVAATS